MAAERRICVVTGTRAEYGLLYWLLEEIRSDADLVLQLAVTGAHLEPRFGETYRIIEADGFVIDEKIDMELRDDTPKAIARSVGVGTMGFADAFDRLRPHVVVVLGDRFEVLAAAQAAMIARIPIAHIHGGEGTEGVFDESIRHSLTKMAQLHFVTAEAYRRRVIQLGEAPERIFNVGAPGIDNIVNIELLERDTLAREVGLDLANGYFLVTYHPVTLSVVDQTAGVGALLAALDRFPEHRVIFTGVNADPGNTQIARAVEEFADRRHSRVALHASLGQVRYLSAMRHAAAVIGNSSSGIIEAPALGVPTVNVGDRQRGRVRTPSIIDCGESSDDIVAAIGKALSPAFQASAFQQPSPYGTGGACARIKGILKSVDLSNILMKRFHDLPVSA